MKLHGFNSCHRLSPGACTFCGQTSHFLVVLFRPEASPKCFYTSETDLFFSSVSIFLSRGPPVQLLRSDGVYLCYTAKMATISPSHQEVESISLSLEYGLTLQLALQNSILAEAGKQLPLTFWGHHMARLFRLLDDVRQLAN